MKRLLILVSVLLVFLIAAPVQANGVDNGDNGGEEVNVQIDIKPGSDVNPINPNSNGVIPVAILTTDDFDATSVDPETVMFGAELSAEPVHYALEDVDGDGDIDMILHFRTQETGIVSGVTEAGLMGKTDDETDIWGTDSVRIVPPEGE